jgi:cytochrome oxidase Cu insertion factor (SCO1/SenC/PrrC family)
MSLSRTLPSRRTLVVAGFLLALAATLGVMSFLYQPSREKGSGIALVGGPFSMINQNGEAVTEKNFAGQYMLVFFGFTFCPDVCPTQLQVMTEALNQMGSKADKITPVFVSVDPERDTPQAVKTYVSNFHPRMVGLTGSSEQVQQMTKAYRVFYQKVENAKRPQDYTMDHSAILYLMGPDGAFKGHFTAENDPAKLAAEIVKIIEFQ